MATGKSPGLREARMPCPKVRKPASRSSWVDHNRQSLGKGEAKGQWDVGAPTARRVCPEVVTWDEQKGASESQRCMSQVPTRSKVKKDRLRESRVISQGSPTFPKEAPLLLSRLYSHSMQRSKTEPPLIKNQIDPKVWGQKETDQGLQWQSSFEGR